MLRSLVTIWCLFACTMSLLLAQVCATAPPTEAEFNLVRDVVARIEVQDVRNGGMTCVPMQANVVRQSNGTGGITQAQLNKVLSFVNYAFYNASIEFFWRGPMQIANNSDYYSYDAGSGDGDTEAGLRALFTPATDAINIYITNSLGGGLDGACGWAYYPSSSPTSNTIIMSKACALTGPSGTFPHEMGHYLGLFHTFEGTENGPGSFNAENVPRTGPQSNCLTKGDLLCGTEADPEGSTDLECNYTGGGADIHGNPYTPPLNNIMSYYHCGPPDDFTEDQYIRAQQGLVQRMSYSTYTLDALPQNVNAPSDLVASLDSLGAHLEWADNATNELGYLIERSTTSATEGFRQIAYGSTDADDTDYNDHTLLSNTTYYFRVKTVNGDCNAYSNVDSVTTGIIYCTPFYLFNCGASPIDDLIFIGETSTISNLDSGCSPNEYGDYTALMADVNAGGTYSLQVMPPDTVSYVSHYIQVWGDWNQDGDFNDPDETMLPAFSEMAPVFNGTITVPVSAWGGITRLRVRVWNQSSGGLVSPCGQRLMGEGEDYSLMVDALSTSIGDLPGTEGMELHPNPATDRLRVQFIGDVLPTAISILDISGRTLRTIAVNSDRTLMVDVSDLVPGVHLMRSNDTRVMYVGRFVKF